MPPKPTPIALRIELSGVTPLVWRRVIVPNHWTLASLHHYVQWVMGWQDSHAHEFQIGERLIAPDWWLQEIRLDRDLPNAEDERYVSVAAVTKEIGVGASFDYRYDMGDGWEHRIVVESLPPAWLQYELPMPTCAAGEYACPPEDVGGPPGYEHFIACLHDLNSAERIDMLRWVGGAFDVNGFDLNRINRDWRGARQRKRR